MNGLPRQLDSLQTSYDRRVKETLADADLSQEYKAELVARLYDEAREKAQKLIDAERDRLEAELRAARRAVFEPDLGGAKDGAALRASYRERLEHAKKLTSADEVGEALEEAELTGDDLMAKALLYRAFALGDTESVGAYLASRPQEAANYEAFMAISEEWNEFERYCALFGPSRFCEPSEYGVGLRA